MDLNKLKEVILSIGGLLGLAGGGIAIHDKYYVEPNQNISRLSKNDQVILNRIKEINKELSELKIDIENNKLHKSSLEEISNKLSGINDEIFKIQNNKVDNKTFNQYHHLSKDNVNWIITSIKNLQGTANLSNQISYWEMEVNNIKNKKCFDTECESNRKLDLKDAQNNLLDLQKLLSNK